MVDPDHQILKAKILITITQFHFHSIYRTIPAEFVKITKKPHSMKSSLYHINGRKNELNFLSLTVSVKC